MMEHAQCKVQVLPSASNPRPDIWRNNGEERSATDPDSVSSEKMKMTIISLTTCSVDSE